MTKKDTSAALDTIETFGRNNKLSSALVDKDTALMQSVQTILKDINSESITINKTIPYQVKAISPKQFQQRDHPVV